MRTVEMATSSLLLVERHLPPLLAYCLSDLLPEDAQGTRSSGFDAGAVAIAVSGLHLLPCQDGSMASFSAARAAGGQASRIVLFLRDALEEQLLQAAGMRVIASDCGPLSDGYSRVARLYNVQAYPFRCAGQHVVNQQLVGASLSAQLSLIAATSATNLVHLTTAALIEVALPAVLPGSWKGTTTASYQNSDHGPPGITW